tara:strand:- start:453 stop:695 length:243 start_codon:yes stop_codon:yes gene_type:complete
MKKIKSNIYYKNMAKSLKKSKSKIVKSKLTPGRAKALVWKGKLKKTPSGLTKKDLVKNKYGKIVSRKKHSLGKRMTRTVN